jgi:ribosomal protein L32
MSDVSQKSDSAEPLPPVNTKLGKDAAPESDEYFKKCPACGKFTRDATVCRHCGHDLPLPPQTKATFSPGERKVANLVSGLAVLLGAGHLALELPPLLTVVLMFALGVTATALCTVTWLRTSREGLAGSTKFAVIAVIAGIATAGMVGLVAIQILTLVIGP